MLRDLKPRDLAWQLAVRDVSALYRQSMLGVFWALSTTTVALLSSCCSIGGTSDAGMPYPLFVLWYDLWQTFAAP
jgi:lipopolysaccharide transport system permease protein